ncbi:hypothetical protein ZWY2020_028562 [Hordeum vulgare]|nr:hypothetical protein ZWY2020_028562 [Hordeum vulgare]
MEQQYHPPRSHLESSTQPQQTPATSGEGHPEVDRVAEVAFFLLPTMVRTVRRPVAVQRTRCALDERSRRGIENPAISITTTTACRGRTTVSPISVCTIATIPPTPTSKVPPINMRLEVPSAACKVTTPAPAMVTPTSRSRLASVRGPMTCSSSCLRPRRGYLHVPNFVSLMVQN